MNEEELWQSTFGASAADDTAAEGETSVETVETDADAHTEEVEEVAAEEVETSEEEKPEEAETTDEAVTTETDQPTETDEEDFQDLLDPIPTPEQLLEKHKLHRPSQAIKDDLTMLSTKWRETQDSLNLIGGSEGVKVLEPVAKLLGNAQPTERDALQAFDAMLQTNRDATLLGILESTSVMLEGSDPVFKILGDELMQKTFGQGVTTEHLRNLVALEQAGMVNVAEDMKLLGENTDASSLFAKQAADNKALRKELDDLKEILSDPEKLAERTTSKKDQAFDADFETKVQEAVLPFLERGKWGSESALAKHVLPSIINGLKNEPEYRSVKAFVAKSGYSTEKMPFAVVSSMNSLTNKAKVRVEKAIREINADLKARPNLNTTVKEKVVETKPKSAPLNGDKSYSSGVRGATRIDDAEEELWRNSGMAQAA